MKKELNQFFKQMDLEAERRLKKSAELIGSIDVNKLPQTPDIICRNCGRSVYVGKCCDNPDIEVKE